jgi:hypothetical protein
LIFSAAENCGKVRSDSVNSLDGIHGGSGMRSLVFAAVLNLSVSSIALAAPCDLSPVVRGTPIAGTTNVAGSKMPYKAHLSWAFKESSDWNTAVITERVDVELPGLGRKYSLWPQTRRGFQTGIVMSLPQLLADRSVHISPLCSFTSISRGQNGCALLAYRARARLLDTHSVCAKALWSKRSELPEPDLRMHR